MRPPYAVDLNSPPTAEKFLYPEGSSISLSYLSKSIAEYDAAGEVCPIFTCTSKPQGLLIMPAEEAMNQGRIEIVPLCWFAINGVSNNREGCGCGNTVRQDEMPPYCPEVSKRNDLASCPKNNIDRAELWASQYTFPKKKDPSIMSDQCSFANTVEGTELFLKTSPFSRLAYHYMYNNEVLTNNWIDVEVSQVPVEAYFYTNPNQDLSLLQSSQLIARAKGIDIPIVFIETPVIKFIYRPQDQAK